MLVSLTHSHNWRKKEREEATHNSKLINHFCLINISSYALRFCDFKKPKFLSPRHDEEAAALNLAAKSHTVSPN